MNTNLIETPAVIRQQVAQAELNLKHLRSMLKLSVQVHGDKPQEMAPEIAGRITPEIRERATVPVVEAPVA